MILTHHGINSMSYLPKCLYCTYFDNFNEATKIDTPLIGAPVNYTHTTSGQLYTLRTLSLFNSTVNALKGEAQTGSTTATSFYIDLGRIPAKANIISTEAFVLSEGTRSDWWQSVRLTSDYSITIDPYYSSNTFRIVGPYITNLHYDLFNNTVVSSYNTDYLLFSKPIRFKTVHIATVCDLAQKTVRYYLDGDLMAILYNMTTTTLRCGFNNGAGGKSLSFTGLTIWTVDKSINNMMNYPVPTKRYTP